MAARARQGHASSQCRGSGSPGDLHSEGVRHRGCPAHDRPDRAVPDRRRRDREPRDRRADGGRLGAGVPPPGQALRRRPRLLRDGVGGRPDAQERAHARLPADRAGRAPAGRAGVRLRSRGLRRRGAHVRRRGRRHRRPQHGLPRAQGDEDLVGRIAARGRRPRLPDHGGRRRRRRRAGHGEASPRRAERLAQRARARPAARRTSARRRSRCTRARPCRCTPARPTTR